MMEQILQAYGLLKETVMATMMVYKIIKAMIRSPDGNADFFDIVAGVLCENTFESYLFITYLG